LKELQATQKSRLQVNVQHIKKTEEDAETNTLASMPSVDGNRKKSTYTYTHTHIPKKAGNSQHPQGKGGAGAQASSPKRQLHA